MFSGTEAQVGIISEESSTKYSVLKIWTSHGPSCTLFVSHSLARGLVYIYKSSDGHLIIYKKTNSFKAIMALSSHSTT